MRFWIFCFALTLTCAAKGEDATTGTPSAEETKRVIGLVTERMRDQGQTAAWFKEREELTSQIKAELYSPSPDLERIEYLHLRLEETKKQAMRHLEETSVAAYRSLSPADRLIWMKIEYPPVAQMTQIYVPDGK